MKKIICFALAFSLLIGPSVRGQTQSTTRIYIAFAFETVTVSTVSIGFTASTIAPSSNTALRAAMAEYSLETCNIRYRVGTAPTATVGNLLQTGNGVIYGWENISGIRFIRDTLCGSDAKLSVHYYR